MNFFQRFDAFAISVIETITELIRHKLTWLYLYLAVIAIMIVKIILRSRKRKREIAKQLASRKKDELDSTAEPGKKDRFNIANIENEELRNMLMIGNEKLDLIDQYYEKINDPSMKEKARNLANIIEAIYRDLIADPTDMKKVRNFLAIHTDSAIKVLSKYSALFHNSDKKEIDPETQAKIHDMVSTLDDAFQKMLNNLHENEVLALELDIELIEKDMQVRGIG